MMLTFKIYVIWAYVGDTWQKAKEISLGRTPISKISRI
jgi:hypothetical protein